ncbi:Os10g0506625 [Oryza sativa Japonica Group]|uniref:Os10g0506625 protein n=1 Tax=Oryza sativa subsp. japonica TaxID=39947 RepID=A0A0P0XWZ8_ORYSJ|nr:Os10g0506625 [Oryza sativa Japonica Group]
MAPATSSDVGRGRWRILCGDGNGTGDELRRGGRGRRLRRGRRTRPPVTSSRRRMRSPAMSSDVDRGRGRMRLPATRFGFGVERGQGRTRPPATTPRCPAPNI